MTICSIPDCHRPAIVRGWCDKHYRRWKANGDPTVCKNNVTSPAQLDHFYREAVKYDGDECLIWPFGRSSSGYAKMTRDGRPQIVSRMICQEVNGPPPTPLHHAAHSCGRGHDGCITRKHLLWKTCRDNQRDRFVHGTHSRGARNPNVRLCEENVIEIRRLYATHTQKMLSERFGVSMGAIDGVVSGRTWGYIKETA